MPWQTLSAYALGMVLFASPLAWAEEPLVDLASEFEQLKKQEEPTPQGRPAPNHSGPTVDKAGEPIAQAAAAHAHGHNKAHWGYTGMEAPQYWHQLSEEFALCGSGKNQSPIDLRDASAIGTQGLPDLDIRYRDVPLKVINNGHTVQVNYPLGSYIKIGGKRYELLQYHFHTPSEHQKEGFNYPMEVHLVHSDGNGNLAVIGVLFQEGQHNRYLDILLKRLPKEVGKQEIDTKYGLNPVHFIPNNTDFYKYSGSLTTPPCSEGVYWMVFKEPIEASVLQIQKMNEMMGENARPVNPLHSRALLKSWSESIQEPLPYEFQ